ncbi:hypothetical protein CVT26_014905 [Gymnopilus dilepis]|uniref:Uncharacterized protein n=1 Tax=Gymnopilus dilepis TaxID=231916 RepID=A0A409XWR8_9AGAR|nr:hypothetical protein CVT26_014905 [Gymnopilus dilepis]
MKVYGSIIYQLVARLEVVVAIFPLFRFPLRATGPGEPVLKGPVRREANVKKFLKKTEGYCFKL